MQPLPPDLIPRSRQILLPLVSTEDDREALLTDAFYTLSDSRIYHQIKRDGSPMGFTTLCIKKLLDYGCLTEGQHALGQLLETTKYYCGVDKHHTIDQLVTLVNDFCAELVPMSDESSASEESSEALILPTQTIDTAPHERTPTIFISYSHNDSDFAQQLITDLNNAGHACWLDTVKIKGGDEWIKSITEGINNSYAFISVVSPEANNSTWVRREFLWAENKKKRIFPVMARQSDLTIYLMERQVIAMHEDYTEGLSHLLNVLPAPQLPSDRPKSGLSQAPLINRRRLELDYLEQLSAEVLFDLEKYTPLGGESQFIVQIQQGSDLELAHMRPEFEHLIQRGEQHTETRYFENAVDEILAIKRAVLLGEPGGGKTTTLLSLAGQLLKVALNDPKAAIPIFVRLGRWTDSKQSLQDFIAREMGALGGHLQTLIDEQRAVPLLDGMNEIPTSQRKAKYEQIRDFISSYPDWVAVTSCREQDYTIDLKLDRISITPLDAIRIREFVTRYLGDEQGEMLFWKIAGEAAQRFEARFEERFADKLEDWKKTFWLAANLPDGLEWQQEFTNTFYYGWQEWREIRDAVGGLLQLAHNPYMLSMLTQVYVARGDLPPNRGELFRDFVLTLLLREGIVIRNPNTKQLQISDEAHALQSVLAELAYEMQVQRGQSDDGNALTVLPLETVRQRLDERQLYLAGSSSILDIGEDVRFTHQLLQEYFAATYMDREIKAGQLQAKSIWKAENWWERTNWEEATILLAGLYSDDCSPVVEWVSEASPEVAALCVARSGAALADSSKENLSAEWLSRLTDMQAEPNPHARVAIGHALGLTNWDNRHGVGLNVEGLPDIDWVEIPAGEFIYQNGEKIDLPAYKMSRYLVTYAQFQSFVDAEDGFHNSEWWEGLAMPEGHNDSAGDQALKYWNHPRERVSWYDAIAFCRWLSHKMGYEIRLPTEYEWEKAARGTDGREYPYEGDFDAQKGNTWETGLRQTSAAGIFPAGASPYGLMDMSGNVWEWCLTDYGNPQEKAELEDTSSNTARVLRGGSWNFNNINARAVSRNNNNPNNRYNINGFRLCVPLL